MYNNDFLPTFPHPPNNTSTSDPFSGVHCADRDGESNLGADGTHWPIGPMFDTHHLSQDPCSSNALVDWETAALWIPGVPGRLPQEALGGMDMSDPASTIHAPYSDMYFDQGTPPTTSEFVYPAVGQPVFPYPLSQVVGVGVNNGPSGAMECQSIPPEYASSRRSAGSTTEGRKTTLELPTVGSVRTVVYEADVATVSSLPLSVPIDWRKIPQERYTPKTGENHFLRLQGVTFCVNGAPGFNMKRALDRAFAGLDGRDRPVLENANGPVSCRLLFLGYPANTQTNQIAVKNWKKKRAPITRSKLAHEVAKRVNYYLDELTATPIDPSADPQWTVGQGCMKIEKMYLVSFAWVSKGSLQPEIWVDTACA